MKTFFLIFIFLIGINAQGHNQQYVLKNNQLMPIQNSSIEFENSTRDTLKLRIKIKKFIVSKNPQGISVKYEPVCEFSATLPVDDLTTGGLVSEKEYGRCPSTKSGKSVDVIVSGMVYDSIGANYSDELSQLQRNFFTHFYLESSEILFGLGDFNLGTTRSFPFEHWMSELSTDSAGGNNFSVTTQREGFITAIRYSRN